MIKRIIAVILILLFVLLPFNVDTKASAASKTYKSADEVYDLIKDNLLTQTKVITVKMNAATMKKIGTDTDLFKVIVAMDDKSTSKDADYLKVSLSKWTTSWRVASMGNVTVSATLTFTPEYRTTLKQEQQVDAKVKSVLESLKLEKLSDYKKVKAIHNYIINRVSYDQDKKKHSAYNALIDKSSVCEGYAAAAYRMFTDAGIACRIITGSAGGGSHAWNIVKVNDKWYNIDLTWDDPISSDGKAVLRYDYFLKNEKAFSNHTREAQFRTKEFLAAYPIAKSSYK